ncbi:uncharacterized protein BJX67DRAFT_243474 [Aspergillus lucknowensis]|uniref:Uncharacterized protein n=1 Tax=Aspergillus lucknowensis TaxID=176173 RepID=A0ABR4M1L3_9EURO
MNSWRKENRTRSSRVFKLPQMDGRTKIEASDRRRPLDSRPAVVLSFLLLIVVWRDERDLHPSTRGVCLGAKPSLLDSFSLRWSDCHALSDRWFEECWFVVRFHCWVTNERPRKQQAKHGAVAAACQRLSDAPAPAWLPVPQRLICWPDKPYPHLSGFYELSFSMCWQLVFRGRLPLLLSFSLFFVSLLLIARSVPHVTQ